MVKHTQTSRRQFADEFFKYVWPFYEIGAERVNEKINLLCSGAFSKSAWLFKMFSNMFI